MDLAWQRVVRSLVPVFQWWWALGAGDRLKGWPFEHLEPAQCLAGWLQEAGVFARVIMQPDTGVLGCAVVLMQQQLQVQQF